MTTTPPLGELPAPDYIAPLGEQAWFAASMLAFRANGVRAVLESRDAQGSVPLSTDGIMALADRYAEAAQRGEPARSIANHRATLRAALRAGQGDGEAGVHPSTICTADATQRPADPHAHWISSADGLSWRNPAPDASPVAVPNSITVAFKYGNEFAPYHPDASHVAPDYRKGWNDCYRAATAAPQTPVQQYPLPDSLYPDSKDWLAGDYAGRVQWLHLMYESKASEVDFWVNAAGSKQTPVHADVERDAARYRVLRHSLSEEARSSSTSMPIITTPQSRWNGRQMTYTPTGLDAALDAEIEARRANFGSQS